MGDRVSVRVLMSHPMESGQRKDADGNIVVAWHIQVVSVTHNGETVLTTQWGPAVSKNPFLQLVVKGAKAGDRIGVSWTDTRGETRADETTVLAQYL